jgi:hypothetical protein
MSLDTTTTNMVVSAVKLRSCILRLNQSSFFFALLVLSRTRSIMKAKRKEHGKVVLLTFILLKAILLVQLMSTKQFYFAA